MFLRLPNIVRNLNTLTFLSWGPLGKRVQILYPSAHQPYLQAHIPVKELIENKLKRLDLDTWFFF